MTPDLQKWPSTINVLRLDPEAVLPTRVHADDAGMDIYGLEDAVLEPRQVKVMRTGVALAIPPGFVGMIADRSSLAKKGLKTAGGIIDSGYRGEIGIVVWNLTSESIRLNRGERIAQMLLLPVACPSVAEVKELDSTDRGAGGFGSSGK